MSYLSRIRQHKPSAVTWVVCGAVCFLSSCEQSCNYHKAPVYAETTSVAKGVAVIHPLGKNGSVHGVVTFVQEGEAMRVVAYLEGLPPGVHGFHIHEYGDCSSPDGSSAGGHFNPLGKEHGAPDSENRHVGDLGNFTADDSGKAHYERLDKQLTLAGAKNILGRAVIIHEKADDFKTQPTGNAGGRIGCGVIGIAKP